MNFHRIYREESLRDHPRCQSILERNPKAEIIDCQRYGEVFNPKGQNFRLQKSRPSLILAKKMGKRVLPTPPDYGLGADRHFYFSHMLNCLYDCRYCFLQGMYRSANYVLFPNFEDFIEDIDRTISDHKTQRCFFFSGYDCDSLAMESLSGFSETFLPYFESRPEAWLELRTKSVNIKPLLNRPPIDNVVVAFSLNPSSIAKSLERGAPSLSLRLKVARKLAKAGWNIGLRIDPIIRVKEAVEKYDSFLDTVFDSIPIESIHSATIGSFRAPSAIFKRMENLYPEEPLFMGGLKRENGMIFYDSATESDLRKSVYAGLKRRLSEKKLFFCQ